ncbi:glutathione S-transferase epsilon 2 [Aphomia sociella]
MSLVLYKVDRSPPVRAVLMTIDILGLKFKGIDVNTLAGEHLTPEYLEKNPMHTVPLLEDGKFALSDSHAIITYLVTKYGAEKREELYPNDLSIRAIINQRLYLDASLLFPRIMAISKLMFRKEATGPSPQQFEDIEEAYGILEKYLEKTKFLATDHLTLADISLVATVSTADILVPVSDKFPKLLDWFDRLKITDFYKNANAKGLKEIYEILEQLKQEKAR